MAGLGIILSNKGIRKADQTVQMYRLAWALVVCKSRKTNILLVGLFEKIVIEYNQEIPQSQTADKPVASWQRVTQQSQDTRKTNKVKQPALSFPSR